AQEQIKAEAQKDLENQEAQVREQAKLQAPVAELVKLSSNDPEERTHAIENLKLLARENKLPPELVPTALAAIEEAEQTRAAEAKKVISEAVKGAPAPPDNRDDLSKYPYRVFIHIRDDQIQQRDKATQAKAILEKTGIFVPGIQNVANAPATNEIRYFR